MTERQKRLIRFAELTLGTLEIQKEWSYDTLEDISDCAVALGLATAGRYGEDEAGYFKQTKLAGQFEAVDAVESDEPPGDM